MQQKLNGYINAHQMENEDKKFFHTYQNKKKAGIIPAFFTHQAKYTLHQRIVIQAVMLNIYALSNKNH